jgi:hypothetical protein
MQKRKGISGALDGVPAYGDKLRIPGVADCLDRAGLGPPHTVSQGGIMALHKTLACGEEHPPNTTAAGCEEEPLVSPVPVANPFGSF